jgi:hypothetical protein
MLLNGNLIAAFLLDIDMNKHIQTVLAALLALLCLPANAVWEMTPEQIVGDFYGSASVCKDIMPAAVEAGLKDGKSRFEGFGVDIAVAAQSEGYKKAFNEEVDRLRSLTGPERVKACEWNWGSWKDQDKSRNKDAVSAARKQKQ